MISLVFDWVSSISSSPSHPQSLISDRSVASFSRVLEKAFDFPFDIWTTDQLKAQLTDFGIARQPGFMNEPFAIQLHPAQHLLLIPFQDSHNQFLYATSLVLTNEPNVHVQLAMCCLELNQQIRTNEELVIENDGFVRQVTEDFEELTFLREIARHLELNEESIELDKLASNVLQLLNYSANAESLALVLHDEPTEQLKIISSHGEIRFDDRLYLELVEQFRLKKNRNVDVVNLLEHSGAQPELEPVRSFIIAPIRESERTIGWLLAVNRRQHSISDQNKGAWHQLHTEFGSNEVTLLESAATMLGIHIVNLELVNEKQNLLTNVVRSLVSALDAKDGYTCGHSERVALYAKRLAQEVNYSDKALESIYLCGLLHDVGKIGISDVVLNKPGALSPAEHQEVMRHPEEGWNILQGLTQLADILPGVLHHHERVDGGGYPDGLQGEQIPLDGRILAVVDAFDAMTSDRSYRKGMPVEKALEILESGAGSQWDSELVSLFIDNIQDIIAIKNEYRPSIPKLRTATRNRSNDEGKK